MVEKQRSGVRVLVVDDHPVFRRGLVGLLSVEDWVEAVLEAGTVEDAVREAVVGRADVVAMDLRLPDGNGLDATRRVLRARPAARVLVLTMAHDGALVREAMRAGARGYVLKRADPEDVVRSLHGVARGSFVLDPEVGSGVLGDLPEHPAVLPAPFDGLTKREIAMLLMVAEGKSNAAIARSLGVVEKTVRNMMTPVFRTIGAADRVQAALRVKEAGISGPRMA